MSINGAPIIQIVSEIIHIDGYMAVVYSDQFQRQDETH
jgi:hypothetical protein